jgi:hypothetical protein
MLHKFSIIMRIKVGKLELQFAPFLWRLLKQRTPTAFVLACGPFSMVISDLKISHDAVRRQFRAMDNGAPGALARKYRERG